MSQPQACNTSLDKDELDAALVIMSSAGGASVLVCATAVALVFLYRLYRQLAYRMALYQVLAAALFGTVCAAEATFVHYEEDPTAYSRPCQVIASALFFLEWVKLMLTNWVTFHLFCFAVLNKNFKRLEALYIVTSIIVPLVMASIPYVTHSYGRSGAWCWIQDWKNNCPSQTFVEGSVETFALWYGPAFCFLLLDSVAMVVMGFVLVLRTRRNDPSREQLLPSNRAHKSALNQLLPLIAYPVIFFVFIMAMLAYRLHNALPRPPNYLLLKATAVLSPGVGLTAGIALLVHIAVAKCLTRSGGCRCLLPSKAKPRPLSRDRHTCSVTTYGPEPVSAAVSTTFCSLHMESEVDVKLRAKDVSDGGRATLTNPQKSVL